MSAAGRSKGAAGRDMSAAPASEAPSVTAIVVCWNSAEVLPDCLGALSREGVAAIVVDNASEDDSAAVARAHGARVITNARNEGYGRGNNIGAAAAASEFVLIVNPDCAVDPGAVAALVAAARRYPDAGLLAPRIVEPNGRFFFQHASLLSPYLHNPRQVQRLPEADCCVPFLSGACFLARRDLFERLGGFDEQIFLFYEDDDLCRRVIEAGASLVHVHEAVARHGRGRSSAPKPGRIHRMRWHLAWSRAYVSRKWGLPDPAPGMVPLAALKTGLSWLSMRRRLIERHGGTLAGARAFMRGESALAREGLEARAVQHGAEGRGESA